MLPATIFIRKHQSRLCAALEPVVHQLADLMQITCTILLFLANVCEHQEFLDSSVLRAEKHACYAWFNIRSSPAARSNAMFFDELSNEEWAQVAPLVTEGEVREHRRGRPRAHPRTIVNAVLWILTTGETWSKLPSHYPTVPTCRRRFNDWQMNGTLIEMVTRLASRGRSFAIVPSAPAEAPRARRRPPTNAIGCAACSGRTRSRGAVLKEMAQTRWTRCLRLSRAGSLKRTTLRAPMRQRRCRRPGRPWPPRRCVRCSANPRAHDPVPSIPCQWPSNPTAPPCMTATVTPSTPSRGR